MVIFGTAVPFLGLDMETVENSIRTQFGNKGQDVIDLNLKAVKAGYEKAMQR